MSQKNPIPEQNSRDEVIGRFTSYIPTSDASNEIRDVEDAYQAAADHVWHNLPQGREKALAITALEESFAWAIKSMERANQDPAFGDAS